MMHGIAWQRDCHEIMKKDQVQLSLEVVGTMQIESWCFLSVSFL